MNTKTFTNKAEMTRADGQNEIFITAKFGNEISYQIFDKSAQKNIILWESISIAGLRDKSNEKIIAHIRATHFQC